MKAAAHLSVAAVPARQDDGLRAPVPRLDHRHGRPDSGGPRLIGARSDDAPGARPADDHRETLKRRVVEDLDGREEGVHVDVQDVERRSHDANQIRLNGSA